MAQFTRLSPRQNIGSDLGQALGQGIEAGTNFGLQKQYENVQNQQKQERNVSALQTALEANKGADFGTLSKALLTSGMDPEYMKAALQTLGKAEEFRLKEIESNKPKAPAGGVTAQAVPPETAAKMSEIASNPEIKTANQLKAAMDSAGVPPIYSNPYVENFRRSEEAGTKTKGAISAQRVGETSKLRNEIAQKATSASDSIQNKNELLKLIDNKNLNDPTIAAVLDKLPLNLGRRFLSNDTVAYKAGLVDEFKDLRNLFQGQTRVAELNILENKIADIYLNDEQKKRILKARIKSLDADVLKGEIAGELEDEMPDLSVNRFNAELNKKMKERLQPIADQMIDELNSVVNDAEIRKKRPLNLSNPDDAEIGRQILQEAGGDNKKAYEIARKRGYRFE